jgi:hypothetical protein
VHCPLPPGGSARIKKAPQPGQVGRSAWPIIEIYDRELIIVCSVPSHSQIQNRPLMKNPVRNGVPNRASRVVVASHDAQEASREPYHRTGGEQSLIWRFMGIVPGRPGTTSPQVTASLAPPRVGAVSFPTDTKSHFGRVTAKLRRSSTSPSKAASVGVRCSRLN